jgi:hypothetical protein
VQDLQNLERCAVDRLHEGQNLSKYARKRGKAPSHPVGTIGRRAGSHEPAQVHDPCLQLRC